MQSTSEHRQKADCTDSIVLYFLSSQVCSSTPESSDRPDIHPESRACLLRSLWEREQHSVHFCATSTSQFQMAKMPRVLPVFQLPHRKRCPFPCFSLRASSVLQTDIQYTASHFFYQFLKKYYLCFLLDIHIKIPSKRTNTFLNGGIHLLFNPDVQVLKTLAHV